MEAAWAKLMNQCRPEKDGHERVREDVKTKLFSRKRKGSGQERERGGKLKGKKEESPGKGARLRKEFEVEIPKFQGGGRSL